MVLLSVRKRLDAARHQIVFKQLRDRRGQFALPVGMLGYGPRQVRLICLAQQIFNRDHGQNCRRASDMIDSGADRRLRIISRGARAIRHQRGPQEPAVPIAHFFGFGAVSSFGQAS